MVRSIIGIFLAIFCFTTYAYASDSLETLKKQLEEHKKAIAELEKRIGELERSKEAEGIRPLKEEERQALFGKLEDRAFRLNQKLSDYSPYGLIKVPSKFFPDISLIVDGSLVGRNIKDRELNLSEIPGFTHVHTHGNEHAHKDYNAEKGFNLNYGELAFSSAVDPYFDLTGVLHISEHNTELEEAFFNTRSLPMGFQLKAGKFYSSFGRLNSQHHHIWDFADQPLIYKVMFGSHNLLEKGAQLNWLAPTNFYLLIGLEAFQGENEASFGYKGFEVEIFQDGSTKIIEDANVPSLWVGFLKASKDIGNLTILGGLSYAMGKAYINHLMMEDHPHALKADSKILGIDLTAKYMLDSHRYLMWQSEFLHRKVEGTRYAYLDTDNDDIFDFTAMANLERKQSGLYTQVVWKFHQNWRAGFRYDLLDKNSIYLNGIRLLKTGEGQPLNKDLYRYSFMTDYSPTEFSRIRLQYNHDKSRYLGAERKSINEIILQFNMSIGAHGAHPF